MSTTTAPALQFTIQKEAITVLQPCGQYPFFRYEWKCPQCGGTVHGDSKKDSIFEIRHDPICITCRVTNGEFRFTGGKYERVKN